MARHRGHTSAADIARYNVGMKEELALPGSSQSAGGRTARWLGLSVTNRHFAAVRWSLRAKVIVCAIIIVELAFLSLGIMGAAGDDYAYTGAYVTFDPLQVCAALAERAYNALASVTHAWNPHDLTWIRDNVPGYWGVWERAGVVGITLVCGALLAVSGMLYQNVFKNPIAGPSMLGVSSGVSLGVMVLVIMYGATATAMVQQRYVLCYAFGAAILVFVIAAGRKLSGKGRPFDIMTMLLIGSILSQFLGFIVSYVTLFVMEEDDYLVFYTISQMLVVDNSALSWLALGIASLAAFIPVYLMRYKMNALAFDEEEMRMLGVNATLIRAIALICGGIMILAAQIHVGMVGMVTLIVPFLARRWFGCEFGKQLAGSVCLGMIVLLACRDIADLIPFVGDGLAIGSVVSVVALPLFVVVVSKSMKEWK